MHRGLFLKFMSVVLGCLGLASASYAQVEGQGCDPDFLNVITSHAEMASSREMETAQRLILKPDSVLQYSCFETHILSQRSFRVFNSSRSDFDGTRRYDDAINGLATDPYRTFVTTNFSHRPGGGALTGRPFNVCYTMNNVWNDMRCRHNFNKDDFRTYEDMASSDERTLPVLPCVTANRNRWASNLASAYPAPAVLPAISPPGYGGVETARAFLNLTTHAHGECRTVSPIPTGVILDDGSPDMVCPLPGCTFDGGSRCF